MTEKEKQEIIELVHKTLRGFFEPFPEGELGCRPFSQTEKVLLEVNKAICEKIAKMETTNDRLRGEWVNAKPEMLTFFVRKCSQCGEKGASGDFCMWCGSNNTRKDKIE